MPIYLLCNGKNPLIHDICSRNIFEAITQIIQVNPSWTCPTCHKCLSSQRSLPSQRIYLHTIQISLIQWLIKANGRTHTILSIDVPFSLVTRPILTASRVDWLIALDGSTLHFNCNLIFWVHLITHTKSWLCIVEIPSCVPWANVPQEMST